MIIEIIVITLFLRLILSLSLLKSLLVCVIYQIFLMLFQSIIVMCYAALNIDIKEAFKNQNSFVMYLGNIILFTLYAIILFLIQKLRPKIMAITKTDFKAYTSIIIYLLAACLVIIFNYMIIAFYAKGSDIKFTIGMSIVFIAYVVLSFILGKSFYKNQLKNKELEQQIFYNASMTALIDELRSYKHGVDNSLASIRGYAKDGDMQKLWLFMDEIDQKQNEINYNDSTIFQNIQNPGLACLIQTKLSNMRSNGINVKLVVDGLIGDLNCKTSDLCEMLGIMLDNALEAAIESKDKSVKLNIANDNGVIAFVLDNSTDQKPDIVKMFEKGWSTKGDQRGMGLWILKRTLQKYKRIIYNIFIEDDIVKQELVV